MSAGLDVHDGDNGERIAEAVARLHPQLQEALEHAPDMARWAVSSSYHGEFTEQGRLLACIDELNVRVNDLVRSLEGEEGLYLWERAGVDLMHHVGFVNVGLLWRGGVLATVMTALRSFAMTRLREEAKKPSAGAFDEVEFARERMIHVIMESIIGLGGKGVGPSYRDGGVG